MTVRVTSEQEMKPNLIGGEWRPGGTCLQNINPSNTDDIIAGYAMASRDDVLHAVSAAEAALPAWSSSTSGDRYEILDVIGKVVHTRYGEPHSSTKAGS